MLASRRIALTGAVALCLAATAAVPAMASADATDPVPCDNAGTTDVQCLVSAKDGVHARVVVPDILCVRVDALSSKVTANAHVRIPCPPGKVPVTPVVPVIPVVPVEPSVPSDNSGASGVNDAPAPQTIETHLPVTH